MSSAVHDGKSRGRQPSDAQDAVTPSPAIYNGIHGLLREWSCGHGNMQTPRTILVGGFGEIIVDISD